MGSYGGREGGGNFVQVPTRTSYTPLYPDPAAGSSTSKHDLYEAASRFLKSLLKTLHDENALSEPELLKALPVNAPQHPVSVPQELANAVLYDQDQGSADARRNAWISLILVTK